MFILWLTNYQDLWLCFQVNGNAYDNHGLVTIRIKPDAQGRFGFNVKVHYVLFPIALTHYSGKSWSISVQCKRRVKGGSDQGMPIIVSRVAPGTPADICIPRLNEGDQVLFINSRDVSSHKHEQVVSFIRASVENQSGELSLVVRPNGSMLLNKFKTSSRSAFSLTDVTFACRIYSWQLCRHRTRLPIHARHVRRDVTTSARWWPSIGVTLTPAGGSWQHHSAHSVRGESPKMKICDVSLKYAFTF